MDLLVLGILFLSVQAKGQLLNFGGIRDSTIEEITRPCRVPTGKSGFCVKQNQCPYISDLIKNLKKPLPGDVALLIRDSFFCPKTESGVQEICCPSEGIDPSIENLPVIPDRNECAFSLSNQEASCELYSRCSPFLQLLSNLRRPIPKTLPKLMISSFVCGLENVGGFRLPKLCCAKEALLPEKVNPTTTTT